MRRRSTVRFAARGYASARHGGVHSLSAEAQVVSIDRHRKSFEVELSIQKVGSLRHPVDSDAWFATLVAPLVELRPSVRRRLAVHQLLGLRVSRFGKTTVRRWQAWFWSPRQLAQAQIDAARLWAALSQPRRWDDDVEEDEHDSMA